jgi:hypothetical protein
MCATAMLASSVNAHSSTSDSHRRRWIRLPAGPFTVTRGMLDVRERRWSPTG